MMRHRIGYGALLIAIMLVLFWLEYRVLHLWKGLAVAAVVTVLGLVGLLEYDRLVRRCGFKPFTGVAMAAAGVLFAWIAVSIVRYPHVADVAPDWWWIGTIGGLFFAAAMIGDRRRRLGDLGVTLLGLVAVVLGLAQFVVLEQKYGLPILVLTLAAVKLNDMAGYFAGSFFGRYHPFKELSPNKSVAGFGAGWLVSIGLGVLYATLFVPRADLAHPLTVVQGVVFGLAVGVAGQLGDLFESYIKRQADAKDSGQVLPAFGGVLDMIDSPLLAGPVALVVLNAFGPAGG